jgi:uncharacterized protein YfkK (UPF0435 family)
MQRSLIKLFKAVEVSSKRKKKAGESILRKTIEYGFILSPEIIYNYSDEDLTDLIKIIKKELGLSAEQMNNSFHKSWKKVKEASIEQLVIEQIIHYFTTYGFEDLGIYNEDSIYIPAEKLEIPQLEDDKIKFTLIKGLIKDEIKEKILELLKAGIALKEDTVQALVKLCIYTEVGQENINDIKNKEVRISLCDNLGIIPENPVEFLRYVIYKATGKTLLIKDKATIETLKKTTSIKFSELFTKYKSLYGLERLAEIFYRFKPIFLVLKTEKKMKPVINKIRKLAYKYHQPMKADLLNNITSMIKKKEVISLNELNSQLDKVNIFRKIRLAYALKYRTDDVDSILYKIRNGKSYATDFDFLEKTSAKIILDIVLKSIVFSIQKNVLGKTIYIPNEIKYSLPATEKQFSGYLPSGSCVTISKNMVFGIYWNNVANIRTDLDLSLMSLDGYKSGWDGGYRSIDRKILFSGDVTDASGKNGASELFYVAKQTNQELTLFINNYTGYRIEKGTEIPFKIVIASEEVKNLTRNYMINPYNIKVIVPTSIKENQKTIGFVSTTEKECKFYFTETNLGYSISASNKPYVQKTKKYYSDYYKNMINLNKILVKAGGILVDKKEDAEIDLSPESLDKNTIINLLI